MEEVTVIDPKREQPIQQGALPMHELEAQVRDHMGQAVEKIRRENLEQTSAMVKEALDQALKPNRERASQMLAPQGDVVQLRGELPAGVRLTPSEDFYYRRLSAEEREYRKPESDYWIAEWLRGMANLDGRGGERMSRAADKLRAFERAVLAEQTITAVSGLAVGTGGALIPLPFSTAIVKARDRIAKIRSLGTRFVSEANSLRVPVSAVVTVAIANEGAAAAAGEGAITSKLLSKRKIQGNFSVTIEVLADSAINTVSYFSERVGSALGAFEDTEVCTSPGASAVRFTESLGSATITEIAPSPATQINFAGMIAMFFGVPQQYRSNAVWMVESSVLALISQIKTTTGYPLFAPQSGVALPVTDVQPGVIGAIFGRPVYDLPLAAGKMLFGDPSYIGLLDGGGIEARVSEHALWTTDAIAYRFTERMDSVVLLENAMRRMIGVTTVG